MMSDQEAHVSSQMIPRSLGDCRAPTGCGVLVYLLRNVTSARHLFTFPRILDALINATREDETGRGKKHTGPSTYAQCLSLLTSLTTRTLHLKQAQCEAYHTSGSMSKSFRSVVRVFGRDSELSGELEP